MAYNLPGLRAQMRRNTRRRKHKRTSRPAPGTARIRRGSLMSVIANGMGGRRRRKSRKNTSRRHSRRNMHSMRRRSRRNSLSLIHI